MERYYQMLDEVRGTVLISLDDLVGGNPQMKQCGLPTLWSGDEQPVDR